MSGKKERGSGRTDIVHVVESDHDTNTFSQKAVNGLSKRHDLVFIFDPDADVSACYFGDVKSDDILQSFFPKAKKL